MCTAAPPLTARDQLALAESLLAGLAGQDAAGQPAAVLADGLRALERIDAAGAALRARLLHGFDAQQGSVADGQRTTRTWLVNCLRVTKGQAGEYKALQVLASKHGPLLAGLRDRVLTKSAGAAAGPLDHGDPGRVPRGEPYDGRVCRLGQSPVTAARWPRPGPTRSCLASPHSLNNQSILLSELGRREEALAAIEEALTIHRPLAQAPDAFLPDLASSLNNLADCLSHLRREAEANADFRTGGSGQRSGDFVADGASAPPGDGGGGGEVCLAEDG